MRKVIALFCLSYGLLSVASAQVNSEIYGVWKPIEYHIDGDKVLLNGLMIITPGYFVGNTTFDSNGDGVLEANANAGPFEVEGDTIQLSQWMQLHWRPSGEGHFLKENVPEDIKYTVDEDILTFHFPSGNTYISKRLSGLQ